ncbi:SMP-30/gluconolactonase/LRE family protein [Cystobacter fuscus]|uniref:SMP-30/gluconolactonase/LRE family protein n=1 Tax=Cystobacter fuscus TaxID=43 RepID=UPI000BB39F16|nr:SMP-30/gluconolactonase/LRE family protein [Cystobacter fuscus]
MRIAARGLLALLVFAAAFALYWKLWPAGRGVGRECELKSGVHALCGINKPEDMLRLGDSAWVVTGNMGNDDWAGGGFYAIRIGDEAFRAMTPDLSRPVSPTYRDCPGAPDPKLFSAHGVALRARANDEYTLYAVNHGGRESIEVFDVRVSSEGPELTWTGCVVLPPEHAANSVAPLPDGGIVATIPRLPSSSEGVVLQWVPGGGWTEVPGTRLEGDNGLLVSPDGTRLYVNEYNNSRVHELSLDGAATHSRSVDLGFHPDNIRFAPDGSILATGHPDSIVVVGLCGFLVKCGIETEVARIDPTTFQATTLFERGANETFSGGTSAVVIGDELWIGSFVSRALLIVPLGELRQPLGAPAASPTHE